MPVTCLKRLQKKPGEGKPRAYASSANCLLLYFSMTFLLVTTA